MPIGILLNFFDLNNSLIDEHANKKIAAHPIAESGFVHVQEYAGISRHSNKVAGLVRRKIFRFFLGFFFECFLRIGSGFLLGKLFLFRLFLDHRLFLRGFRYGFILLNRLFFQLLRLFLHRSLFNGLFNGFFYRRLGLFGNRLFYLGYRFFSWKFGLFTGLFFNRYFFLRRLLFMLFRRNNLFGLFFGLHGNIFLNSFLRRRFRLRKFFGDAFRNNLVCGFSKLFFN